MASSVSSLPLCSTAILARKNPFCSHKPPMHANDGYYRWNHFSNECLKNIHDDLLRAETKLGAVTAVFQVRDLFNLGTALEAEPLRLQYIST